LQGGNTLVGPHPPGAYAVPAAVYAVVGTGWSQAHLLSGALVIWLCWDGMRRLGAGLPAAAALASCGLVWTQATNAGVDLMAAACVVQSVSWLVASDRLRVRRAAMWWGAWMGAGFLTKYTAPLFLWGPCLLAAWWVVRGRRWKSLAWGFAAFSVVAGIWYATHGREVAGYIGASGDAANPLLTNRDLLAGPWWGWERMSWYPAVVADAWGIPGAAALLFAICMGGIAKRRAGAWAAPLLAVAGGWLALTLQIQRQDRYLTPAAPLLAAAVSGAAGWAALPVLAAGAYGAARIYGRSGTPPANRDYAHGWPPDGGDFPWMHDAFKPVSLVPEAWQLDRAVQAMAAAHGADTGTVALMLDEQGEVPGFGVFLSAVTRHGHRWDVATVMLMDRGARAGAPPPAAVFVGPFTTDAWPPRRFRTLFAVVRPGDQKRLSWVDRQGFVLSDSWALPQGMEGRLYVLPEGAPDAGPDPLPEPGTAEDNTPVPPG
ncbi:MAG: hypothetical protein VX265_03695, partial [Myxococcota bacterium]|nr:hypothetical protein [Myxococcota bacterium]